MHYLRRATLKVDAFLTPGRVVFYATMWLLIALTVITGYVVHVARGGFAAPRDFDTHVTSGRIVVAGDQHLLYDLDHQRVIQHTLLGSQTSPRLDIGASRYLSPPFVAYLYVPLAILPYGAAVIAWTIFTLALIALSLGLLWPLVPNLHHHGFARVLLLALATAPAVVLLFEGQDSAISLFLLALGLRLLLSDHDLLAGSVLGLGLFKPQLFVLMPVLLLLQRRWRALAGWICTALVLGGLSVAIIGLDGAWSYVHLLISDPVRVRVEEQNAAMMLSLKSLAQILGFGPYSSILVGLIALVIVRMFGPVAIDRRARDQFALLYAATVLITVLINPHVYIYDGVIFFVPVLILLNAAPERSSIRVAVAAACLLTWLLPLHYGSIGLPAWTVVPNIILLIVLHRLLAVGQHADVARRQSVSSVLRAGSSG